MEPTRPAWSVPLDVALEDAVHAVPGEVVEHLPKPGRHAVDVHVMPESRLPADIGHPRLLGIDAQGREVLSYLPRARDHHARAGRAKGAAIFGRKVRWMDQNAAALIQPVG